MVRNLMGSIALLGALTAAWAAPEDKTAKDEKAKSAPLAEKPKTPREQVDDLRNEHAKALADFRKLVTDLFEEAEKKGEDPRTYVFQKNSAKVMAKVPNTDQYTEKALRIAKDNPKGPVAFDALEWVICNGRGRQRIEEAIELVQKDHLENKGMGQIVQKLPSQRSESAEKLLRSLTEKNPDHEVKGQAYYNLARFLRNQAATVRSLQKPGAAQRLQAFEKNLGKEYVAKLKKMNAEELDKEGEITFELVTKRYGEVKTARVTLGELAGRELFEIRHLALGKVAPDIEGEGLDGKKFKLSDYRGKVVVLDFWGHWSGSCRAMYPYERSLIKRLENKPFALIGVNSDQDKEKLKKAIEKEHITWKSFWNGPEGKDGPLSTAWNVRGWPTTYVLDPKGVIRYKDVRNKALDDAVDNLLAEMEKAARK